MAVKEKYQNDEQFGVGKWNLPASVGAWHYLVILPTTIRNEGTGDFTVYTPLWFSTKNGDGKVSYPGTYETLWVDVDDPNYKLKAVPVLKLTY